MLNNQHNLVDVNDDLEDDDEEQESWLPGWKDIPKLMELKQNFKHGSVYRDENLSRIDEWLDNFHIRGKAKIKPPKGFSGVQPKLIRKQAEWRYAPLSEPFLATPDLFVANPVTWEDKEAAMQHQLVLNNQFSTVIDRVAFIDEYIRTAVDEGTVFVRVGWRFEEAAVEQDEPQYRFVDISVEADGEQDMANLQAAREGMMHHKPEWEAALEHSMRGGKPLKPEFVKYISTTKKKTIVNQPTVEVIPTHNLTVDPTCNGVLDNAQFLVYAFETSLAELTKAGKYHDLDKLPVSPSTNRNTTTDIKTFGDQSFNFSDKQQAKIVAYEYWGYHDVHKDGSMVPFVATWVGDVLIRMEDNPFPDGKFPFVSVQYLPVRKSIYGEPDGALIEDNQKIVGAITRGMVDIIGRSANGQTGVAKGALDVPNKRRYDAGMDYEFNNNVRPENSFYMHKFPEIPQSAPLMLQLQNNEADSFTGVKAFSGGLSGDALGRTSAAGVRGVLDAASKREVNILRRLAAGMIAIGNKIIAMNTEFLDEREIIRVTNEDFIEIQRDKLVGRFDLKLTISTAEEDQAKAEELAFMLQTVGQTIGTELAQKILADIARLRKMPDLAKKIDNYKPQPDPLEQRLRELEVAFKETEIMERQAKAKETMANAELIMSKVNTESAKATNLQANTDMTNLEMIEQESGTKQERDIEAIQAQAKGNMQRDLFGRSLDTIMPKAKPGA